MNRSALLLIFCSLAVAGCDRKRSAPPPEQSSSATPRTPVVDSLTSARAKHVEKVIRKVNDGDPVPPPPAGVFNLVHYPSNGLSLQAYVGPDPGDHTRHPAIVWITGGDCNSIGEVWTKQDPSNDQTAAQYRNAGIVMMYPSLRGGNDNPGSQEKWYGEVDDVISAGQYLASLPWVDPKRIYLGGHSTGGTLALLVSECTDKFRAVFCFGPVTDVAGYGNSLGELPFDMNDRIEVELRSPGYWLPSIKSPTFVFEGDQRGNLGSLLEMSRMPDNPPAVKFFPVKNRSHFSILAPANELIAKKILNDTSAGSVNISFTAADLAGISGK